MALITTTEALTYLPQVQAGSPETALLTTLIAQADATMAQYLGYARPASGASPTLESAAYTLYLPGPGGRILRVPCAPVTAVTSIHDDLDEEYGTGSLVAATDYSIAQEQQAPRGIIRLVPTSSHGLWTDSRRSQVPPYPFDNVGYVAEPAPEGLPIKVVCTAGYATTPADIARAAGELVAHWWNQRGQSGKDRTSAGQTSTELSPRTMPPVVRELLAPYRLRVL